MQSSTELDVEVGQSLTIEVPSTRDAIASASAQAEHWLLSHNPAPSTLHLLLLAIEEVIINCIDHGYDDDNLHVIFLTLSIKQENLTIAIVDDGHPFNPLAAPAPNLSLPVQSRPVGGLGIHLLRQLSDHVAYERSDGRNKLVITRQLR